MSDTHGATSHTATITDPSAGRYAGNRGRRITTETKVSYKTTGLIAYVVAVIGVLVASALVDGDEGNFGAQEAWFYVTLLTIGYMISRGLAKAGSAEPFDDEHGNC